MSWVKLAKLITDLASGLLPPQARRVLAVLAVVVLTHAFALWGGMQLRSVDPFQDEPLTLEQIGRDMRLMRDSIQHNTAAIRSVYAKVDSVGESIFTWSRAFGDQLQDVNIKTDLIRKDLGIVVCLAQVQAGLKPPLGCGDLLGTSSVAESAD